MSGYFHVLMYVGMISLGLTCLVVTELLESVVFCFPKFREFLAIISSSPLSFPPLSPLLSGLQ